MRTLPTWILRRFTKSAHQAATGTHDNTDVLKVIATVSEVLIGLSDAGLVTVFNGAAEHLWGCLAPAVIGQPIHELIPDFPDAWLKDTAPKARARATAWVQWPETPTASRGFAIELQLCLLSGKGQTRLLISVSDLRTARRSGIRLERVTKLYEALAALNHGIRETTDEHALFKSVCQIAVDLGGVAMAWIGTSNGEDRILPIASYGTGLDYLTDIFVSTRPDRPEGRGPSALAFRNTRAVIVNNFTGSPLTQPWQVRATSYGFLSNGSFPIPRGGQPFAVLTVYHGQYNVFDEEMIRVLQEIAENVTFALEVLDQHKERQQAQDRLVRSESHFRAYFEQAMIGMAATGQNKKWLEVNSAFCAMLGYTREELLELTWTDITHPSDLTDNKLILEKFRSGTQDESVFEKTYLHKTRRPVHVRIAARCVRRADHSFDYVVLLIEDITERKKDESMLSRLAHILNESSNEIFMFDAVTRRFLYANASAQRNTGYSLAELERLTPPDLKTYLSKETFGPIIAPLLKNDTDSVTIEGYHQRKNGSRYPFVARVHLSRRSDNNVFVAIIEDVSERKEYEAKLLHQTTHDALTGLPNRVLLQEILNRAMAHAQRHDTLVAILLINMDAFKNINEALGHSNGDLLLQDIAQRLTNTLRAEDWVLRSESIVSRQGGDEFTIVLQGIASIHAVTTIAERLLAAVREPFSINNHELHVTASMGITVYPFDEMHSEGLLRNVGVAMHRAKRTGNGLQFYAASMGAQISERRIIETGLRQALAHNEFVVHYQPQIDLASGHLIGMEALVRWQHPEKGLVPPGLFIPIAEETGFIIPIGEWVLRTACQQTRIWHQLGFPGLRISVNLSARQFKEPELPALVAHVLKESGLNATPEYLELEVTESILMEDTEKTVMTLKALHDMGVRLAIDDFGTGYSSLNYLRRFPINTLKIDQSFVRDITTSHDDAAIATMIITLGHSLGLNVIAEGVETKEQLAFLTEARCNEMQGYYYSRPLTTQAMEQWLKDHSQTSP